MKPYEIENWAIRVVERVNAKQPNEDSRVELKAEWPEPAKAARRIAGHANSAGGDHILWLIGVDQASGVVGADHKEFANWLAQVRTHFDELFAPPVVDLNVPWNGKTIVALLFQTDRKPFVVKNSAFGKPNGGPVALEVPWRDGTAIRSASRRDLLQLLVPLQLVPDCEVHNAQLVAKLATTKGKRELTWALYLTLFVVPKTESRVVIPEHLCEGGFNIKGKVRRTVFESIEITAYEDTLIKDIGEGISIEGPGLFRLEAKAKTKYISKFSVDAELSLALKPTGASPAISINVMLPLGTPLKDEVSRWSSSLLRHAGIKLFSKKLAGEAFKKFERERILRG